MSNEPLCGAGQVRGRCTPCECLPCECLEYPDTCLTCEYPVDENGESCGKEANCKDCDDTGLFYAMEDTICHCQCTCIEKPKWGESIIPHITSVKQCKVHGLNCMPTITDTFGMQVNPVPEAQ